MNELAQFLEYLVGRDVLDRTEAEHMQSRFPLFIGLLAVKRNYLSFPRVNEILDHQRIHGGTFGDVAKVLGMLDEHQIETLVNDQKSQIDMIGRALLGQNKVTESELRTYLRDFRSSLRKSLA